LPPPQDRCRIRAQHEHIKNVTTHPALTGEGGGLKSSSVTSTASTVDGTRYPITFFLLKRLEIGSCVLSNVEAMLVSRPMPEPLLGMSALLRMNVEMRDRKMSLSCPANPARPAVAPGSGAKPRKPRR